MSILQGHSRLVQKPNRIINPFMRYDQRFASLSGQKIDVDAAGGQLYTLDRWFVDDTHSGGSIDMWREAFAVGQTEVPGSPRYFMRYQAAAPSGGTQPVRILQRIEDVTSLLGDTGVHMYVRADTEIDLDVTLVQKFGSGGGSADVVLAAYSQTLTADWAELKHQFSLPSILGKLLGSGEDDCIELRLSFPENTAVILDLANVAVSEGAAKPAHEMWRDAGHEFSLCRRFYRKSYDPETAPGTVTTTGQRIVRSDGSGGSAHYVNASMRSTITGVFYSPATGTADRIRDSGTDRTVSTASAGSEGFTYSTGGITANNPISFHYTAEAEL